MYACVSVTHPHTLPGHRSLVGAHVFIWSEKKMNKSDTVFKVICSIFLFLFRCVTELIRYTHSRTHINFIFFPNAWTENGTEQCQLIKCKRKARFKLLTQRYIVGFL